MRVTLLFLLCFLFSSAVFAQKYNIYETELDNGLDVIVLENSSVPLVTIELDVRNGGYTEPPEYDGLSHLYEHMFFKANASIPNQELFVKRLEELGAIWNASTGSEQVNYFITIPSDSLEPGMEFMKAAITTPLFQHEELVKERPVITAEYDRNEANPYFHLFREIGKKLWYKYYSRKNVIGDREVILTADHDKMVTIQNRYYIPNNSAIIISGNIKHENIFKLANKIFGEWKRGDDPFKKFPFPEHPPLQKSETVVVEKPVKSVTLSMQLHGPSVSKDLRATFAADVLSYILSQNNSNWHKNLIESGLFSNTSLSYSTLDHTGPITIFSQTTADKYKQAEKALFAEIEKLTNPDYFSDDQIEYAKTQLEISDIFAREKPSEFSHTIGFWWSITGSNDYYLNYIDNLKSITREDIKNYLKKYIIDAPYVKGILISPEDSKKLGFLNENSEGDAL